MRTFNINKLINKKKREKYMLVPLNYIQKIHANVKNTKN